MPRRQRTTNRDTIRSATQQRQGQSNQPYLNRRTLPPKLLNGPSRQQFHNYVIRYGIVVGVIAIVVYFARISFVDESDILNANATMYGGWRPASDKVLELYDTEYCNIDRIYSDEITAAAFEEVYRYKKPVIVKFKNGARDWIDPDLWTVGSLKKTYGERFVASGNGREIVRHGGTGYVHTSFTEYVDDLMNTKDDIGEPL